MIDQAIADNQKDLLKHEKERDDLLRETGNWLHTSVPISNDEVRFENTTLLYNWLIAFKNQTQIASLLFLTHNAYRIKTTEQNVHMEILNNEKSIPMLI